MSRVERIIAILAGLLFVTMVTSAGVAAKEAVPGLDEQVQDIKGDVLAIAAELNLLEEKLLYPSGTQVALFVSLPAGDALRLDAVSIRLGGEEVAHHLYTFRELEALQKGAVQRIYTGNLRSGEHPLEVTVAGKTASGADYRDTVVASVSKAVGPRLVEIRIAPPGASPAVEVREW